MKHAGFSAVCPFATKNAPEWPVSALFAVHPGGPKIIEQVADRLGLRDEQVAHSRAVLLARGNMSSATLPHVWADLLADRAVPDGQRVVTLAFGPGLTLAGGVFCVER